MQMRSTVFFAAAMLLVGSVPAHAVQANGQAAAKSEVKSTSTSNEKKICKRLATSGTRMAERVCLTKEEWKKVEAQG